MGSFFEEDYSQAVMTDKIVFDKFYNSPLEPHLFYNNNLTSINFINGIEGVAYLIDNVSALVRANVDGQNGITTTDALLTLRNSLGLDMTKTAWQVSDTTGDVNCDNSSKAIDAVLLLRHSLGLDMSETDWCE